jgi:hypothetical protein
VSRRARLPRWLTVLVFLMAMLLLCVGFAYIALGLGMR